jgi:hypothetical protein
MAIMLSMVRLWVRRCQCRYRSEDQHQCEDQFLHRLISIVARIKFIRGTCNKETGVGGDLFWQSRNFFVLRYVMRVGPSVLTFVTACPGSAIATKRTRRVAAVMSANDPKRTFVPALRTN